MVTNFVQNEHTLCLCTYLQPNQPSEPNIQKNPPHIELAYPTINHHPSLDKWVMTRAVTMFHIYYTSYDEHSNEVQ